MRHLQTASEYHSILYIFHNRRLHRQSISYHQPAISDLFGDYTVITNFGEYIISLLRVYVLAERLCGACMRRLQLILCVI